MGDETKPVAIITAAAEVSSAAMWYCNSCTKLILPPGSEGTLDSNGERYCPSCHSVSVAPTAITHPRNSVSVRLRSEPPASRRQRRIVWISSGAAALIGILLSAAYVHSTNQAKVTAGKTTRTPPSTPPAKPLDKNSAPKVAVVSGPADKKTAQPPADAPTNNASPNASRIVSTEAPAKPVLSLDDFNRKLKDAETLMNSERFKDADVLLNDLGKEYASAAWWGQRKASVATARETLSDKVEAFERAADEAAVKAQAAGNKDVLGEIESAWKPKLALGEFSAKPATRVIEAVHASRERLTRADFEKRAAAFIEKLEKLEGRTKTKLSKAELEAVARALQELKARLAADPVLAEKFAARWAGLKVDLVRTAGAARDVFRVDSGAKEPSEWSYDFKNSDQAAAWSFQGEPGKSSAEYDPAAKAMIVNVTGEQSFDANTGTLAPSLQLPFCMNAATWSFEADASVQKAHSPEKKDRSVYFGILVSDGDKQVIRIGARESSRKGELHISARGSGDEKSTVEHLPGKPEDKLHFRIVCNGNMIGFSASANSKPVAVGRTRLTFEPKILGMFVETRDKDESAQVAFTSAKLTGTLNKEKLKSALEAQRANAINAARDELRKGAPPAP